jgi:4a-hydroxytetrahydrobiopterin dehydratase
MARPALLTEEEILQHLPDVPLWRRSGATIVREFAASEFAAALGLVNAIGLLAERADHHPDLLIYGWNKVRVTLSTHDQGGLTVLDFRLAHQIDALSFNTVASGGTP